MDRYVIKSKVLVDKTPLWLTHFDEDRDRVPSYLKSLFDVHHVESVSIVFEEDEDW